jgi:formylglycine-generating enzyme required for sulfatase activity
MGNYQVIGDNLPVGRISWDEIQEFIKKLNEATGKNYRLPTEAEWEYAARGGNKSKGYKYSGSNDIDAVALYFNNSSNRAHPVGIKAPNELGIYDMTGNVAEFCSDWYGGAYTNDLQTNPTGPETGSYKIIRGGDWFSGVQYARFVYSRYVLKPTQLSSVSGFRLVLQ